jgi:hypothetical protein
MTGAGVHFVVLAGRALLIADVQEQEGLTGPLTAQGDPVAWSFLARGLRLLPAYVGQAIPETDELLVAAGHGQVALTTSAEVDVLAVPHDEVPEDWFDAADQHEGVVVLVGRGLDVDGLDSEQAIGQALDEAAGAARLLGATVALD